MVEAGRSRPGTRLDHQEVGRCRHNVVPGAGSTAEYGCCYSYTRWAVDSCMVPQEAGTCLLHRSGVRPSRCGRIGRHRPVGSDPGRSRRRSLTAGALAAVGSYRPLVAVAAGRCLLAEAEPGTRHRSEEVAADSGLTRPRTLRAGLVVLRVRGRQRHSKMARHCASSSQMNEYWGQM